MSYYKLIQQMEAVDMTLMPHQALCHRYASTVAGLKRSRWIRECHSHGLHRTEQLGPELIELATGPGSLVAFLFRWCSPFVECHHFAVEHVYRHANTQA